MLDDLQTKGVEAVPRALGVCEQTDFLQPKFAKDLTSRAGIASVDWYGSATDALGPREIRPIRIVLVRPTYPVEQLGEVAVSQVFRSQVDEHAAARLGNGTH